VLDDGLDEDGVDALVGEGDLVRVGDELCERAAVDVEPDDSRPAIGVDRVDAVAERPAADDDHEGRCSGEKRQQ
jgi:hypothetical protein